MGQLTYSDRASELFTIRTQHQALTLGTKRASALGAATLERETRNAEKEQQTRGRLRDGTKVGCNP